MTTLKDIIVYAFFGVLFVMMLSFDARTNIPEQTPQYTQTPTANMPPISTTTISIINDVVNTETTKDIKETIKENIETMLNIPPQESTPPQTTTIQQTPTPQTATIPFNEINTSARKALVNILCTTKSGGLLNPISGSGIIIDPKGIILTNAHVAQYFLLKDYYVPDYITCIIRIGSPAKPAYTAKPLYISESWIYENAEDITAQEPLGTGQYDYALIGITGTISGEPITNPIPYVDISVTPNLEVGAPIFIGGYPAGFAGGITVQKDLNITSTLGVIDDVFTFIEQTIDLITVKGSIVSQHGVSGGAVIDNKGDLIAIVVTSTTDTNTSDRVLGAITADYIKRDFKIQTGTSLDTFLQYDVLGTAESFWTTLAPPLIKALETVLDK